MDELALELEFPIGGETVPVDHGYVLNTALSWLHEAASGQARHAER